MFGWPIFRRYLKYEVATVHGIVKVLATDVVHARGMEVEPADVRVVDRAGARGVDQIGAVGGGQGMQGEGVLALRPCEASAPDSVGQGGPAPSMAPRQGASQGGLRVGFLAENGHRRVALHQRILDVPVETCAHRRRSSGAVAATVVLAAARSTAMRSHLALLHFRLGGSYKYWKPNRKQIIFIFWLGGKFLQSEKGLRKDEKSLLTSNAH